MAFKNYSTVILLTNHYLAEGIKEGDVGTIIEVYKNGEHEEYEVDFSDEKGITIAQIVLQQREIKLKDQIWLHR